jgi:hypothetical protein
MREHSNEHDEHTISLRMHHQYIDDICFQSNVDQIMNQYGEMTFRYSLVLGSNYFLIKIYVVLDLFAFVVVNLFFVVLYY